MENVDNSFKQNGNHIQETSTINGYKNLSKGLLIQDQNKSSPQVQQNNQIYKSYGKQNFKTQMSTDYTHTYIDYGKATIDLITEDVFFLQLVLHQIPQNYLGADIGSCDGLFGKQIMEKKTGKVISVDPYPVEQGVIKLRGQDYLNMHNHTFDFVVFKHSIHFFQNFQEIYASLNKALKPNGKIFIMSLLPDCKFPWSDRLDEVYKKATKNYIKRFTKHQVKTFQITTPITIRTQIFKKFLIGRGHSNLLLNTEQQIMDCVNKLPSVQKLDILLKYSIQMYSEKKI